jgi:hypothetical protein
MAMRDLLVRMRLDDKQFQSGLKSAQSGLKNFESAAGGAGKAAGLLSQAMTLGVGAGALYLARQVGEAVWELGKLGAQSLEMRASFEDLAAAAGSSGDAIVAAIKRATGGTVAEMDIIAASSRGIMLGLGAQADQWEELTEVARFRARAMGMDVTQALNDIVTGIGRQSALILDNLGIVLDTNAVYDQYAQSIGKVATALTEAEKKQALMNAVITEGQGMIQAAGGIQDTYADAFRRLDTVVGDFKTAISEELAPAVSDLADQLAILGETASGPLSEGFHRATSEITHYMGQLSLLDQVTKGNISMAEAWQIAVVANALRAKGATDAANAYITAMTGTAQAEGQITAAHDANEQALERLRVANWQAAQAVGDLHAAWLRALSNTAEESQKLAGLKEELAEAEHRYNEELAWSGGVLTAAAQQEQNIINALRAKIQVLEDIIRASSGYAHEAFRIAEVEREVTTATTAAAGALDNLAGSSTRASIGIGVLGEQLDWATQQIMGLQNAIEKVDLDRAMVTGAEAGAMYEGQLSSITSKLTGMAGIMSAADMRAFYGQYQGALKDHLATITGMTEEQAAFETAIFNAGWDEKLDKMRGGGWRSCADHRRDASAVRRPAQQHQFSHDVQHRDAGRLGRHGSRHLRRQVGRGRAAAGCYRGARVRRAGRAPGLGRDAGHPASRDQRHGGAAQELG